MHRPLALAVLLVLGCVHEPRAPALDGWRELRSSHFRLRTDLPAADARTTVERLETLRAALQSVWSDVDPVDAPGTTLAIVLRDRAELRTFTEWTGLATVSRRGPLLIASGKDVAFGDLSPQLALLAHEVAHGLDRQRMPGAPRWFDEGLASYLESAELVDPGGVRLGALPREDLEQTRTRPLVPLDTLERTPWETASLSELVEIYRSARLWVHLLRAEEPGRMRNLEAAVHRGVAWRVAWADLRRDLDTSRLEDALRRWLHAGELPTELRRFPPPPSGVDERTLAPWEVHLTLSELWTAGATSFDSGDPHPRARAELEAAARAAPEEPLPQVALADLESDPDRRRTRAEALRRAYPRNPDAAVLLARVLRDGGGPVDGRRTAMLDAVALAPDDVDALTAHALEEARAGELSRAFLSLRRAEELAPWNPRVFVTRAAVLAPLGHCADAVVAVQRALDVLPDVTSPGDVAALTGERARIQASCRPARGP
ncbi:MAG TPA: hypothetical protein VMT11_12955 [Myxococcaceae bacterium]|nr:hypothetical protein [Myxococcaceae bacterium]